MIESRKSRYSYGIIKTPKFDPRKRVFEAIERDSNRVKWLLRKVYFIV